MEKDTGLCKQNDTRRLWIQPLCRCSCRWKVTLHVVITFPPDKKHGAELNQHIFGSSNKRYLVSNDIVWQNYIFGRLLLVLRVGKCNLPFVYRLILNRTILIKYGNAQTNRTENNLIQRKFELWLMTLIRRHTHCARCCWRHFCNVRDLWTYQVPGFCGLLLFGPYLVNVAFGRVA